jgi:hypothetical protein
MTAAVQPVRPQETYPKNVTGVESRAS